MISIRPRWRWFATGALALTVAAAVAADSAEQSQEASIRLRSGVLRGANDDAGLRRELLIDVEELKAGGPALIRLDRPLTPELRTRLAARGIHVESVLGHRGLLVQLPEGGFPGSSTFPGVRWLAPYHPGLRIAPQLLEGAATGAQRVIPVTLHVFSEADAAAVAVRLAALGYEVSSYVHGRSEAPGRARRPGRVVLRVPVDRIATLAPLAASWPETLWVDRRPVYRLLNDQSAWVLQSGLDGAGATPLYDRGILGSGQVVGVLDTGLDADMCFFRDDVLGLPPFNRSFLVGSPDPAQRKVTIVNFLYSGDDPMSPTDWDDQDHGTHVAGSIAGDDLANLGVRDGADGVAPAAKLVIQDGGFAIDDCADMPALGCPAADLYPFFEQAYLQGARIHSNSYGDRENFSPSDIYSDGSEAADAFMWDHPDFLLLFAAGNGGPGGSTIGSPATAKNVVAVGATAHGVSSGTLASFSSRGPTHDGRIKPDVTAPGVGVVSANADGNVTTNNCGTQALSGTSMACPTTAGFAALVREYYERGFYPNGSATPPDALVPSAALLKATLIASAVPMENLVTPPPSDEQGWGRILVDDALYFPGDRKRLFVEDVTPGFAAPADPAEARIVRIIGSSEPLRVVLPWTDYPSTPVALTNLVNDLDLEVESPTGTIYRGNVLVNGVSVTGGTADALNNVEVVNVDNPETGDWIVRVSPAAVPQPDQPFALVVTGRLPVAGVYLDRVGLVLHDAAGGDDDGTLEPGEWVDLDLTLLNSGDTRATNVGVVVESLSVDVEVIEAFSPVGSLDAGQSASAGNPQPRIRLKTNLPCTESIDLRLHYQADGFAVSEEVTLPTGRRAVFLAEDFETPTAWQHVPGESTATSGDWTAGDPDGTAFQPEDDASPAPGINCLFTATNPGGVGSDDVDGGQVVARSGVYDLSGRPDARLSLMRWFANRDLNEDVGDFFALEIRESALSSDVLLEQLGSDVSAPTWTRVDFRVADFITPGAAVELRVSAADGSATGNIIEAAIDEIEFWEPQCDVHDPAPNAVIDLHVDHDGTDVALSWTRPPLDPSHGETATYGVYRSESPSAGFVEIDQVVDLAESVGYTDGGAVAAPALVFYEVIAANVTGDSDALP